MKTQIGIWLDREKAVIVTLKGGKEVRSVHPSGVIGHHRLSDGSRPSRPYGPQIEATGKKADERQRHELHKFYQALLGKLESGCEVLIMGPGETKGQLEKEIEDRKDLKCRIAAVLAADKMTEGQITAKVRDFFLKKPSGR